MIKNIYFNSFQYRPTHTHIHTLTYSMKQSPSWEATWFSASQEIPCILWNPKFYYCIHTHTPKTSNAISYSKPTQPTLNRHHKKGTLCNPTAQHWLLVTLKCWEQKQQPLPTEFMAPTSLFYMALYICQCDTHIRFVCILLTSSVNGSRSSDIAVKQKIKGRRRCKLTSTGKLPADTRFSTTMY